MIPGLILCGVQSGKWYLKTIHRLYGEKFGNSATPQFLAMQVNFEPINNLLPNKLEEAAPLIAPYFNYFEVQRQPYILANITLHESVKYFNYKPKHFISLDNLVQNDSHELTGTVAILGSLYTMNHYFVSEFFPNNSIITLPTDLQLAVDELRKTYYQSNHPEIAHQVFTELGKLDVDGFVIACTELADAYTDANIKLSVVNLPELQCQSLINAMTN